MSNADPLIGRTLQERYRILGVLARGGMGCVYRAEQLALGRSVAVKTIDRHAPTEAFRARFLREAALAARLRHPNTVRVFDYGTTDGA